MTPLRAASPDEAMPWHFPRAETPDPIGDPLPSPLGDPPLPISPDPQPEPQPGPPPEIPPPPATPREG